MIIVKRKHAIFDSFMLFLCNAKQFAKPYELLYYINTQNNSGYQKKKKIALDSVSFPQVPYDKRKYIDTILKKRNSHTYLVF